MGIRLVGANGYSVVDKEMCIVFWIPDVRLIALGLPMRDLCKSSVAMIYVFCFRVIHCTYSACVL